MLWRNDFGYQVIIAVAVLQRRGLINLGVMLCHGRVENFPRITGSRGHVIAWVNRELSCDHMLMGSWHGMGESRTFLGPQTQGVMSCGGSNRV